MMVTIQDFHKRVDGYLFRLLCGIDHECLSICLSKINFFNPDCFDQPKAPRIKL
ncbi:hypothetical protein HYPBUDRAFT_153925 [Hyphopichia burtonii NRRL Y-1933]|uniref:Uncharacterized protein n=1 Tax=Hyphopichia burtonii NRRL Y-1933 TaxID=984485 RepID=A0A1E4REU2_9ASCO|nr:hypothetical protein HYPBUDRAFT_153925 [Hyphopichia burtonii NRRL Y-1933]ODV65787.1 hypothetical protein HYPBUDRAFT_153925 [Hyphopichia burtonii NRRL Y-1933]